MKAPKIVFMGTPAFAVPSLNALCERPDLCQVVGVFTQPDRRAGRGQTLAHSAVKTAALARGLPVFQPEKLKDPQAKQNFLSLRPDLAVVAAYGKILSSTWLGLTPLGFVNVHASLLPRHRGASPIAHAIMAGDKETGISIMQLDPGMDTGPVYTRRAFSIRKNDTRGSLTIRLAEEGAALLVETLPHILEQTKAPEPQSAHGITLAPRLTKEHGWMDFGASAVELERQVRGLSPWPGTFCTFRGQRVRVVKSESASSPSNLSAAQVGQVLDASASGVFVACGTGVLRLDEVQPAGKKPMSGAAWVTGRGIKTGDVFDRTPPKG